MKIALQHGDRPLQALCLLNFADIHRYRHAVDVRGLYSICSTNLWKSHLFATYLYLRLFCIFFLVPYVTEHIFCCPSLLAFRKHSLDTILPWRSWQRSETVSDKLMSTWELQSAGFWRKNLIRFIQFFFQIILGYNLCLDFIARTYHLFLTCQALESLQRAQELADGMGNKVNGFSQ